MKKILILTFIILSFSVYAQKNKPKKLSLLYKVTGKKIKKPTYLFGTMHLTCKEDFVLNDSLKAKLKNCSVLYEEMLMSGMELQLEMIKKMVADSTLKSQMSETDYAILDSVFLKEVGMSIGFFNKYKPFMASSMLTMKLIDCKKTVMPEEIFTKYAKENNIECLGLESVDDQINAISKMPNNVQIESLIKMVKNMDSSKQEMKKLQVLYSNRDIDGLAQLMSETKETKEFEVPLLIDRNKNWLNIIVPQLKEKSMFIAVGAAHLGGKNGLINLLKEKGYTVEAELY